MIRVVPVVSIVVIGFLCLTNAGNHPATEMTDIATITSDPEKHHNKDVHFKGIVTSVCKQEGCFIDLVPLSGEGQGIFVSARHNAFKFPTDVVGKVAVVNGMFYNKIYPFSRMDHWYHHGWRAWEDDIPSFARIFRVAADHVEFLEPETKPHVAETPLVPHLSPVFDLETTEFEAARMGTGKKYLEPGEITPEHSTRRYHELLFVLEGELTVRLEGEAAREVTVQAGKACYIPPQTEHLVRNDGKGKACYIFVYSLPEQVEKHSH